MRIVVTGASGQLGSYLLDRLIERPHEIVAWSGADNRGTRRHRAPAGRADRPAVPSRGPSRMRTPTW